MHPPFLSCHLLPVSALRRCLKAMARPLVLLLLLVVVVELMGWIVVMGVDLALGVLIFKDGDVVGCEGDGGCGTAEHCRFGAEVMRGKRRRDRKE